MANIRIEVELSVDRRKSGRLVLKDSTGNVIAGPFDVLGKSDNTKAASTGNPTRDPLKLWGDTPEGTYSVPNFADTGDGTPRSEYSYGPDYAIVLEPESGDALKAKQNGRWGLLIHGGAQSTPNKLRPTYGCLRLSNGDMRTLLKAITTAENSPLQCKVTTISVAVGNEFDGVPGADESDPPPNILDLLLPEPKTPIVIP